MYNKDFSLEVYFLSIAKTKLGEPIPFPVRREKPL